MPKFEIRKVEEIKASEVVQELVVDGVGVFETLETQLSGTTFIKEIPSLKAYIQHLANGGNAGKKLKVLKGGKSNLTEYEFISPHLRLYGVQLPGRKILIFGGTKKKSDSSDNIGAFRNLLKQYLDSLTQMK
jgi:hypothetical protein